MNWTKYYREARNVRIEMANKWKAVALKAKRNGSFAVAIAAARQYRRCMREVAYYEERINGR